ncbi:MAG: hypothetical protein J6A90_06275 [Clostridia bacterium]|nr:hypothetical protein [Clostridia bacterium]
MENLNLAQKEYLVDTEYNADLVGLLLGDEYFIEKLANRNLPLVEKIFKGLKNLNKKSAAVDKASAKYLNKLVNKFGKAIDNAHGGVSIKSLGGTDEEKKGAENVDFVDEKRYNKGRSRTKDYYSYGRVGQANISTIRNALTRLFFGTNDVIANSFAIESGNCVYIVDSAKTNGKIEFGVFEKIEIDDDLLRKEYVRRKNDDAISKGYISDELFAKLGRGNDSSWRSDRQHALGEELSTDTRESQDNQGRVSKGNENSGEKLKTDKIDDTRYSISKSVDSEGNSLSAEQAEYFKDSKVRDENGNLLVVYHGSEAVFNEFKHRYINTHGSQEGRGFYFTDSVNMASGYERDGGQLLKGYVNISKPLSDTELTLTRKEVASLIKAIDPTGDDLIANYDTGGGMGYPSQAWYNRAFNDTLDAVMNYCDTDSEVLAELRNAGADEEKLLKTVRRTLGYDGYITSEKYENAQIFVAFESNQFKNVDNTAPTDNPDIRYSKSKNSFSEQVDDVLDGKDTSSTHLYVMDTPSLLQEAGLPSLPILLTAKHLKSIIAENGSGSANYHGLDKEIVKKLPEYIADPVMMADSFTRNDSVVIVTEVIDSQNRPVIAAIMLKYVKRRRLSTKIAKKFQMKGFPSPRAKGSQQRERLKCA